jgi:hypothetical protein
MESKDNDFECILHANLIPRPAHSTSKTLEFLSKLQKLNADIEVVHSFPMYVLERKSGAVALDSEILDRILGDEVLANDPILNQDFDIVKAEEKAKKELPEIKAAFLKMYKPKKKEAAGTKESSPDN